MNDLHHGVGIYIWPDGKTYHGEWSQNKQDGIGIFKNKHNKTTLNLWCNGAKVK